MGDDLSDYINLDDNTVIDKWINKITKHVENFVHLSKDIHNWADTIETSGYKLDKYIQKFNENCDILDVIENNLTIIEEKQKELFDTLSVLETNSEKIIIDDKLDKNTINQLYTKLTDDLDKLDIKTNKIIEYINDRTNLNDPITSILNEQFFTLNYLENQIEYINQKITEMKNN